MDKAKYIVMLYAGQDGTAARETRFFAVLRLTREDGSLAGRWLLHPVYSLLNHRPPAVGATLDLLCARAIISGPRLITRLFRRRDFL